MAPIFLLRNYDDESRRVIIKQTHCFFLSNVYSLYNKSRLRMNAIKINCLMIQSLNLFTILTTVQFKSSCYAYEEILWDILIYCCTLNCLNCRNSFYNFPSRSLSNLKTCISHPFILCIVLREYIINAKIGSQTKV